MPLFFKWWAQEKGGQLVGKMREKLQKPSKIKGSVSKSHCEARHGRGLEGLLNRYFDKDLTILDQNQRI